MKKLSSFILFVALSNFTFADEKTVDAKITNVTVFLKGAQVEHKAKVQLQNGINTIVFSNLSQYLDPNTFEVSGTGFFSLLSIVPRVNYLTTLNDHPKIKSLKDSLQLLQQNIELYNEMLQVYENEKTMILSNKSVVNNSGFDIEDVDDLAQFYRKRLTDIATNQIQTKRNKTLTSEHINRISNQINELSKNQQNAVYELVVEIMSNNNTTGNIEFKYFVNQAGWSPSYDIRVKDSSSPLNVQYKANVYQNTGFDWKDVNITLSTANPSLQANKPELYPWRISYITPIVPVAYKNTAGNAMPRAAQKSEMMTTDDAFMEVAETMSNYVVPQENMTNSSFNIQIPKSILSQKNNQTIEIQSLSLKANYNYFSAPKINKDVFLIGKISEWEDFNLLPGQANIYYQGTYTGKTYFDAGKTSDTLEITLGRENGIVVNRTKINEFTQKQTIGSNKKEIVGMVISVRNTKNIPVTINLADQLPVSTDASIEVEIIEVSGGKIQPNTGIVNWNVQLEPAESMSYTIKYSVKYPKDKKINHFF
jgi:uncharacterized protein (TIGR02231 family)